MREFLSNLTLKSKIFMLYYKESVRHFGVPILYHSEDLTVTGRPHTPGSSAILKS
jgi:hypothetical protein